MAQDRSAFRLEHFPAADVVVVVVRVNKIFDGLVGQFSDGLERGLGEILVEAVEDDHPVVRDQECIESHSGAEAVKSGPDHRRLVLGARFRGGAEGAEAPAQSSRYQQLDNQRVARHGL